MLFTTNTKELIINPMHCRIPLNNLMRDTWLNISLDLNGFFNYCLKGTFIIDGIALYSYCKVRRIFTMKGPIMDSMENSNQESNVQMLPRAVEYPIGVSFFNQLYCPNKVVSNNIEEKLVQPKRIRELKQVNTVTLEFNNIRKDSSFNEYKRRRGNDSSKYLANSVYESTQESISKVSSRFKDIKRHDKRLFNSPLIPKNNDTTKRRDKSQPNHTKRPSKGKIMFTAQKSLAQNKEYDYMLLKTIGANQLNTFGISAKEESCADEIEEVIEAEDKIIPIQEIMEKKWVIGKEQRFECENEGEESPIDCIKGLMSNEISFRPFTPPFAQLQSFSTKIKSESIGEEKELQKENVDLKDTSKEEKLDVMYDPILKCYYEPKTGSYYQCDNL